MSTVRTHIEIYRNFEITFVEWCGSWQPRPRPLDPDLPTPSEMLIVDATAPSLEAALMKAKQLIDRMLNRPLSADRQLPRPIPAPC